MSLYHRFCQLDRNGGGFVSADEFMSVPEFAVNPLSQVRPPPTSELSPTLLHSDNILRFAESLMSRDHATLRVLAGASELCDQGGVVP